MLRPCVAKRRAVLLRPEAELLLEAPPVDTSWQTKV